MLQIAPALSSVIAAVTNAVSTYGPLIAKYAAQVLKTIGTNLPQVINTLEAIDKILGINAGNAQELGAKAAKSERKPENFDSFHAYINHLKDDIILEPNDAAGSEVETLTQQAVGASILVKGIGENLDANLSLPMLGKVVLLGIAPAVVLEMVKSYASHGLNSNDFVAYITGNLPLVEVGRHSQALVEAFQNANSGMTLEQAEDAVMALR